jgi:hypothetical protein
MASEEENQDHDKIRAYAESILCMANRKQEEGSEKRNEEIKVSKV